MSDKLDEEKLKEFLKGLTVLSNFFQIKIGGCGCCGSPFLDATKNTGEYTCKGEEYLDFKEDKEDDE